MQSTMLQDKILFTITENVPFSLFDIGKAYKQLKSFDKLLSAIIRDTEQRRPLSEMVDILEGNNGN